MNCSCVNSRISDRLKFRGRGQFPFHRDVISSQRMCLTELVQACECCTCISEITVCGSNQPYK